jgi:hypothetical protein
MKKYANTSFEVVNNVPAPKVGNIVQIKIPGKYNTDRYICVVAQTMSGNYSLLTLGTANRFEDPMAFLDWNTLAGGTQIEVLAIWNNVADWIKDGSPL